jgi:hypothetical protein
VHFLIYYHQEIVAYNILTKYTLASIKGTLPFIDRIVIISVNTAFINNYKRLLAVLLLLEYLCCSRTGRIICSKKSVIPYVNKMDRIGIKCILRNQEMFHFCNILVGYLIPFEERLIGRFIGNSIYSVNYGIYRFRGYFSEALNSFWRDLLFDCDFSINVNLPTKMLSIVPMYSKLLCSHCNVA